jgi:hypothetical protein
MASDTICQSSEKAVARAACQIFEQLVMAVRGIRTWGRTSCCHVHAHPDRETQ